MESPQTRRDCLKAAGIATLPTIGLAGCVGGSDSDWKSTVGLTIPKSGPQGFLGELIEEGGQTAIDAFNEKNSTDIELRVEDSEGETERARTVTQELIDDNVPVAGGSISSDVTLSIRELVEQEELPYITPFGTNTDVTQPGTNFMFRNGSPNNPQLVDGYLRYMSQADVSSTAVLAADYSFGRTVVETLRELAPEYDIELSTVSLIPLGTENFSSELGSLNNDAIDSIMLLYPGAGGIPLVQELQDSQLAEDNLIIGDYTYHTPPLMDSMGTALEGLIYAGADESSNEIQPVVEAIESEYDHQFATYNIIGYDLVDLMASAVNQTNSLSAVAVRDTLRETTFENVSGWQSDFDDNGNNVEARLILNQFVDDSGSLGSELVFRSDPLTKVSL